MPTRAWWVPLALLLLTALAPPGTPVTQAPGAPVHVPGAGTPTLLGAAHAPPAFPALRDGRPLASGVYYTQIGATMGQLNGTSTITGFKSLSLQIPLVSSVYPIGYELNGLSSTGDWYQVLVGDNWPGCPGFEMLYEVWANNGVGNPPGCDASLTLTAGDRIQLGINFSAGGGVCLTLADLTRSSRHAICSAQPDAGARSFALLGGAADANGYFTGPMTEIANTSATACPDYRYMPTVSYEWPAGEYVTGYTIWSDEFLLGSSAVCYQSATGGSLAAGDPSSAYTDTAAGTSYGPHWVAVQNYSMVNGSHGFRVQTDPVPLTSVHLASSATALVLGGSATLNATVAGGVAPYTALWSENGTITGPGGLSSVFTAVAPGTYRFAVYGVDARWAVVGPSGTVVLQVNAQLAVGPVTVNTTSGGADVGQSVRFQSSVSGGIGPYQYTWSGLPTGCTGGNGGSVACRPTAPGAFTISLSVTDSNATTRSSGPMGILVSPALLPTVGLSAPAVDLGGSVAVSWSVSGGSGGVQATWSGLPGGCSPPSGSVGACAPAATGIYSISVSVTDSNGGSAVSPAASLEVFPALSASIAPSRSVFDAGSNLSIIATVRGGAGGYVYAWSGLPNGCVSSNSSILTCALGSSGTFSVVLSVTDAIGGNTTTLPLVLFVFPALSLTLNGSSRAVVGGTVTLNGRVSGGSSGWSLEWLGLPTGCSPPAGPNLVCTPTEAGTYNVTVRVHDSGGGYAELTFSIVVSYPPSEAGAGYGPWIWYAAGAAVVALVLAGAAVALRARSGPSR